MPGVKEIDLNLNIDLSGVMPLNLLKIGETFLDPDYDVKITLKKVLWNKNEQALLAKVEYQEDHPRGYVKGEPRWLPAIALRFV